MTLLKIIVIIVAITTALAARKQLIDVLDELRKFDTEVLQEALDRIPDEPENRTVVKVISSSPKTVREKLVEYLEKILRKLKGY